MMFYIFDFLLTSIFENGSKGLWNGYFCCGLGATSLIILSKLNETSGKGLSSHSFHLYFNSDYLKSIEPRSMKSQFEENFSMNPNLSPMSFIHLFANSLKETLSLELGQELIHHVVELICRFFASGTSANRYSRVVLANSALLHSLRILNIVYLDSSSWEDFLHDDKDNSTFFNAKQCYIDILAILVIVVPNKACLDDAN